MSAAFTFVWDARIQAMRIHPGVAKRAAQEFDDGETYVLGAHQERSSASHRHYFGMVARAWENLPERVSARFPTSEHLRKAALIKAGFYDERSITLANNAEARATAAFVKPLDDFASIYVQGATVVVMTAKSQSEEAMGPKDFQRSKEAVLAILSNIIGVDVTTLRRQQEAA